MKEISRTLVFLAVAALSVLGAAGMHWASRPKAQPEFEDVGKPFFANFKDPTEAKGLRVVSFDEDTASIKEFEVLFKDGKWRIPSHHDYPADGADRLAKTAASVIEITKDGLASPRASDHARFNVIDPLDEDPTILKGRGQRITITGADGAVLSDYIIGKKVEKRDGYYYVRNPKESQTYLAKVEISLSTKFGDWIESDLLKLDADKLVEVDVEKYSVDRSVGEIVNPETSKLTRATFSDPWKLEGLDEETEELKGEEVRSLVSSLDDLRIVGIRPKPAGLTADLRLDPKVARNPIALQEIKNSLLAKGFLPLAGEDGSPKLYSTEGEVIALTNEGVEYVLNFGEVFTGSEMEIESGFVKDEASGAKKADEKKDPDKKPDADKKESKEDADEKGESKEKDKKQGELKKSRYLMVMARVNDRKFGPPLVEPELPEPGKPEAEAPPADKPDGDKPEAKKDDTKKEEPKKDEGKKDEPKKPEEGASSGDEDEQEEEKPAEEKAEEKKPDDKKAEAKDPADTPKADAPKDGDKPAAKPDAPKDGEDKKEEVKGKAKDPAYEAKMAQYKADLEKYKNDLVLHEEKVEKAREQVAKLNKRFGAWYYVISAESFDALRLSRAALVKPKAKPPEDTPDAKKPADGKADEGKPDAKKPEDAKPDEKKPDEKKPDEAKPDGDKSESKKSDEK